jgi:inhibitor of KinA sporulation pathway (predicted exonuclease)
MSTPKSILVIDVEATCWEHLPPNLTKGEVRNEIIEIGLAVLDIKTKAITEVRSIMVKPPTTTLSPFCIQLTTITPELIEKEGIDFKDAINILTKEYRAERNIFASWGDYDRTSFEKNCKWNGVDYPFSRMHLNVKTLFAAKFGYNGGQQKCGTDLGITMTGTAHRGVDDAKNIALILKKLL